MDSRRRGRRSRAAVRAVTAGLCAVLAAVAVVAVIGGLSAERSAARLARSGDLVEAYLDLTRAVAIQDAAEESLGELRVRRARFDAAAVTIAESLGVLEREGTAADQALRARIERSERSYAADTNGNFDAIAAGDADRARAFEEAADPASQALQSLVSEGGPRLASDSLREIDSLRRFQGRILRFTLVSVVLGACIVVALWLVLRSLRRRIDGATSDELDRLERATLTDSLTGTRNHRALEEDLVRALAHRRRHGTTLSLVVVDLDGLKAINDSEGHQAGDRALKTVADVLGGSVRAGELVYRTGGDEFAALLPEASAWGAFNFAQRLHASLDADDVRIRVSVGLAEATEVSTRDGLFEQADLALSEAKAGGRDTIVFVPGMARPEPSGVSEDDRHRGTLASALARAVDAKDSYTRSHSETVAELCAMVAVNLGLDPEHVASIRLAGLVHDVGKIGVPDAILQKPAALDVGEYETIRTHAALGHRILHGTDLSREAPWVLHHHERMDGRGYPHRLAGDEIPVESRIIHVADAFEAMTSDRPYRRGMPESDALEELHRHTATQFDPDCVAALLAGLGIAPAVPVGAR